MKWIAYLKGSRGLKVLVAFIENGLIPNAVVLEKSNDELTKICSQNKIEFFLCSNPSLKEHIDWLTNLHPNFLFCVGYSKIIPKSILLIPEIGSFNCHGGKLPQYRGASPIPWQLINGETKGGAYILRMTTGIDDGPILSYKVYDINDTDNATTLTTKVDDIFSNIAPALVKKIICGNNIKETAQSDTSACYWTRRIPQDGLINWARMTAQQVVNLCRGLSSPYPSAFTVINKTKVCVHKAKIHTLNIRGVPGRYVGYKSGVPTIIARDRAVAIESFTIEDSDDFDFPAKYGDNCKLLI